MKTTTLRTLRFASVLFASALLAWAAGNAVQRLHHNYDRVAAAPVSEMQLLPAYHPVCMPGNGFENVLMGLRGN